MNFTVLVPCVAPKFVPVIVTEVPTGPDVTLRLPMFGAVVVTVNITPLLATPPTVTTTFPVVAPLGTGTTITVALQLVGTPAVPLNVTVLVPCVAPKFVPVIVTEVPTGPDVTLRLPMLGAAVVTVNITPLLATPPTVTTTFPVVAPLGTGTTITVALQLVGTPAVPLNVTVLVPCVAPKFVPVIVTDVPTGPDVTLRLPMFGAVVVTVNITPLLATPPTVTTTFPVVAPLGTGTTITVALQLVGTPAVPLNVTVLVPCVAPKFVPVIVTEVPTGPDVALRPAILASDEPASWVTPAQPWSMIATAPRKERALRRVRKVSRLRNAMLKALPVDKQTSNYTKAQTRICLIARTSDQRKFGGTDFTTTRARSQPYKYGKRLLAVLTDLELNPSREVPSHVIGRVINGGILGPARTKRFPRSTSGNVRRSQRQRSVAQRLRLEGGRKRVSPKPGGGAAA